LAVPGDVDRKHVAGCLALIRDGATLAREPADVLEAIGRLSLVVPPARTARAWDAPSAAVLQMLEAGPLDFDQIVAGSGLAAPAALCALAVLELDGAVESRGGASYARVGVLPGGEEHG
jgi:DNA processing protein